MSLTSKRTRIGKPSISVKSCAISFCGVGGIRVRRALRCSPGLVDESSERIEADLDAKGVEPAPANTGSIRSGVRLLLLLALIVMPSDRLKSGWPRRRVSED